MILRRLLTLTALTVAALLSLGDRANAGYDVSTQVLPGGSLTGASSPTTVAPSPTAGFSLPAGNGGSGGSVSAPFGYVSFIDGGGSTVYLVNSYNQNLNYGASPSIPQVNVFINFKTGDTSTWGFTDVITVTNPSVTGSTNSQFTESATYNVSSNGANPSPAATLGPTTAIIIQGTSFFLTNPLATSVALNTVPTGSVSANITSVPEPASVVMLGAGLVGVVGLGLRRKKRQSDSART